MKKLIIFILLGILLTSCRTLTGPENKQLDKAKEQLKEVKVPEIIPKKETK